MTTGKTGITYPCDEMTDDEKFAFDERCAICITDGGLSEDEARVIATREWFGMVKQRSD